jgi:protein-disulfide isomerase
MEATRDAVTIDVRPFIWPITAIIISLILSVTIIVTANILVGGGFKLGGAVQGATVTRNTDNTGGTATTNTDGTVTVSLDDDAILGDKSTATVAIVEFSDFECPFCQSFWKDTLPQIEETYVKSGQVILVYRDLPLSFHEPGATLAANIME